MPWFRSISGLARVLVLLFLTAQFAGVVASPLQSTQSFASAVEFHLQHHHMHVQEHGRSVDQEHDGDGGGGHIDHCCALHAFFTGVLPAVITVGTVDMLVQRLAPSIVESPGGIEPGRFDRPPRSYALI